MRVPLLIVAAIATGTLHCGGPQEVLPDPAILNAADVASGYVEWAVNASERDVFPTDEELRLRSELANRLVAEGSFGAAQGHLDVLVQARPTWWSNHLALARLRYYGSNRIDLALDHMAQCLEIAPNMVPCWTLQGQLLRDDGQNEAALRSYSRALELVPGSADVWEPMSRIHLAMGAFEDARNFAALTMEARPDDLSLRLLGATIEERAGDLDAAEFYFRWIAERHSDRQLGLTYLMRFYERTDQDEAAIAVSEEIQRNTTVRDPRRMREL